MQHVCSVGSGCSQCIGVITLLNLYVQQQTSAWPKTIGKKGSRRQWTWCDKLRGDEHSNILIAGNKAGQSDCCVAGEQMVMMHSFLTMYAVKNNIVTHTLVLQLLDFVIKTADVACHAPNA